MEVAAAGWTLSSSNGRKFSCPSSSLLFLFKPFSASYLLFSNSTSFYGKIQGVSFRRRDIEPVRASSRATTRVEERWILEPVGDGDSRHIGYKVERPGALEIASDEVIVGRVQEKADLVIPVGTNSIG